MDDLPFGWSKVMGVLVSPAQRMFVASGLEKGLSASAIIDAMKGTNLAIRRQTGLALVRELKGAEKAGWSFDSVPLNKRLSDDSHQKGSAGMRGNYSYWGQIETVSSITGEKKPIAVNFSTNERLSRGEIIDEFEDIGDSAIQSYGLKITGVHITSAYKKG